MADIMYSQSIPLQDMQGETDLPPLPPSIGTDEEEEEGDFDWMNDDQAERSRLSNLYHYVGGIPVARGGSKWLLENLLLLHGFLKKNLEMIDAYRLDDEESEHATMAWNIRVLKAKDPNPRVVEILDAKSTVGQRAIAVYENWIDGRGPWPVEAPHDVYIRRVQDRRWYSIQNFLYSERIHRNWFAHSLNKTNFWSDTTTDAHKFLRLKMRYEEIFPTVVELLEELETAWANEDAWVPLNPPLPRLLNPPVVDEWTARETSNDAQADNTDEPAEQPDNDAGCFEPILGPIRRYLPTRKTYEEFSFLNSSANLLCKIRWVRKVSWEISNVFYNHLLEKYPGEYGPSAFDADEDSEPDPWVWANYDAGEEGNWSVNANDGPADPLADPSVDANAAPGSEPVNTNDGPADPSAESLQVTNGEAGDLPDDLCVVDDHEPVKLPVNDASADWS